MSHFAAKCPSEAERRAKKKDYRIKLKQFLAPFIISQIQSQDPLFYKNRSGGLGNLNIFKPGFLFYFGEGGGRSGYRLLPEYLLLLIESYDYPYFK